ncbi:MAG: rhomboid family intramembrane serine protease [Chloroflexi bacterium]|nr:rhomboid family intramembrane serine protease [Chloroflexota bacterium]
MRDEIIPEDLEPQQEGGGDQPVPDAGQAEAPEDIMSQPVFVSLPARAPRVTFSIIAITILVYLVQISGQYLLQQGLWGGCPYIFFYPDLPACYGMKINELIVAGQYWRLFTPMLLHGNLLHIGFNMYALYILGPELERHFGHWQFLALYVVSGFTGVVASFIFTSAPSLGASTAVFGLLAAQGVFAFQNLKVFGRIARRALSSIVNLAVINLIIGLSVGIDNWGHMGGLIGGGLITWFSGPVYRVEGVMPKFHLENTRQQGASVSAILGVFTLFSILATGMLLMRGL